MPSGIRILLVDDHDVRREATKFCLEQEGYEVTPSSDCFEARRLLCQDCELLIIDFTLHHRSGCHLAEVWRGLRPASPIILSSSPRPAKLDDITIATPMGLSIERLLSAITFSGQVFMTWLQTNTRNCNVTWRRFRSVCVVRLWKKGQ
jgi:CheY-like chemotaxis protein